MNRWAKGRIKYIHLGYSDFYDFDSFVIRLLEGLKEKEQYSLLLKINYNGDMYAMVGKQIGFMYENTDDLETFEVLHETLKQRIDKIVDNYDVVEITSVQLLYVLIEDMPKLKLSNVNKIGLNKEFTKIKDSKERFNFIPLTIDENYFGDKIINDRLLYVNKINKQRNILNESPFVLNDTDKMHLYKDSLVIISKEENSIISRSVYNALSGILIDEVKDFILSSESFIRKIGNVSLTISEGSIVKIESEKVLSPMKYVSKSLKDEANPFIGSWDVEAFTDKDGYAKVYALGFAVLGEKSNTYYLDNGLTSEQLVLNCLNDMLTNKYNGFTFYTHNFGRYDSTFLLKILKEENLKLGYEHYDLKELCRDNKILKLTIKVKKSLSDRKFKMGVRKDPGFIKITIVDSLNILNQSLDKLCHSFEVPVTKGNFPYSFVKRNTLHYVGNTPSYEHWENISLDEYTKLVKPDWDLKEECLSYLDKDLISLVMIMNKFSEYINRKYHLQVTESLTISRLALNIFFKDYLKDSKLPVITKNMFNDIKQAYYGGVTEVYKPYGTNLLHYDVNSLYPFAALNSMPGTNCTFIENSNGSVNLHDLFGFFYCEIKTSDNYLGLLPVHHKEGMIMPNGTWTGWYFSEELKHALDKGYAINVIKGYNFNKVDGVFTDYVKDLYEIKSTTKDKVEKDIAKRLLNHLLGRFGLNIVKPVTKCVTDKELSLIFSTREVLGKPMKITNDDYWITYNNVVDRDICEKHGIDYIKVQSLTAKTDMEKLNEFRDVSLSTAAAVTAYARIYMSKVKEDILNKGGNIYYTDTDSIVTDMPLDSNLVGDGLGKFKLEYKIKQGYYISNKTYYVDLLEPIFDSVTKKLVSYIVKSKSVISSSLTLDSFKDLYKGKNVSAMKRSAVRDFYKGSVTLVNTGVELNSNSYTKREKIFKENKWIDTKPLVIRGDHTIEKKKTNLIYGQDSNSLSGDWASKFKDFLLGLVVVGLSTILYIHIDDLNLDLFNSQPTELDIKLDVNLDELIEAKYNDDYLEEPVEIDLHCSNEKLSFVERFTDLFKDKSNDKCSLYKNSIDLKGKPLEVNHSHPSVGVTTEVLVNERPNVLTSVLKHELDFLHDEVKGLKEGYSLTEIQRLKKDNLIWDALTICKKALRGSPMVGCNSPALGIYTSVENSPLIGSNSPILGRGSAFSGWGVPLNG